MRKFTYLVVLINLWGFTSILFAVDYHSLMSSGNKQYEAGEFAEAAQAYEKVLMADGATSSLYYNLGCSYFNLKQYGNAILNFEKAKQLDPRDPDIQHNLEFSRLFLKDRFDLPEPMPLVAWVTAMRYKLSLSEIRLLELTSFVIFVLSFGAFRLLRNKSIGGTILVIVFISGISFLMMAGWLWDRALLAEEEHIVLLVKEANISSAPIPGSSTLFVIHEGTSAKILDATDTWYEIRLPDGKTGWIKHEAVGKY